jgi:hypothetical protein
MSSAEQMLIEQLTARVAFLEKLVGDQMSDRNADPSAKKTKKAKKADDKEPKEPKKKGFNKDGSKRKVPAISGYRVFSKEKRDEAILALKEENHPDKLTEKGNAKQGAVVAKLGEWWKALGEDEQQIWKDDAKEQESERLAEKEESEEGDLDIQENSSDDED